MLNIYINTWGNYNERGAYGGEWVTLPMQPDELNEEMKRIAANMGDHDPEFCIHDYEWTIDQDIREINENESIRALNDELRELCDLDEWEQKTVIAAIEAWGMTVKEAIEKKDDFILHHEMDLEDVARELVQECYFTKDTPEIFERYFDFAAFARDLSFDGYEETSLGVIYQC